MQLNTPSGQRQRHNYQPLFYNIYKFPLPVFLFLVTVGGVWMLLLLFVFSFHLESKKGLHVLSLFSLQQVILILDSFMICVF